jgi:hypothetical protein
MLILHIGIGISKKLQTNKKLSNNTLHSRHAQQIFIKKANCVEIVKVLEINKRKESTVRIFKIYYTKQESNTTLILKSKSEVATCTSLSRGHFQVIR